MEVSGCRTETLESLARLLPTRSGDGLKRRPCESHRARSAKVCSTLNTQACVQANRAPMTKQMFGRMIKKYTPGLREFQKTVDGTKQWMYGGIGLRNENSNHSILATKNGCQQNS